MSLLSLLINLVNPFSIKVFISSIQQQQKYITVPKLLNSTVDIINNVIPLIQYCATKATNIKCLPKTTPVSSNIILCNIRSNIKNQPVHFHGNLPGLCETGNRVQWR